MTERSDSNHRCFSERFCCRNGVEYDVNGLVAGARVLFFYLFLPQNRCGVHCSSLGTSASSISVLQHIVIEVACHGVQPVELLQNVPHIIVFLFQLCLHFWLSSFTASWEIVAIFAFDRNLAFASNRPSSALSTFRGFLRWPVSWPCSLNLRRWSYSADVSVSFLHLFNASANTSEQIFCFASIPKPLLYSPKLLYLPVQECRPQTLGSIRRRIDCLLKFDCSLPENDKDGEQILCKIWPRSQEEQRFCNQYGYDANPIIHPSLQQVQRYVFSLP